MAHQIKLGLDINSVKRSLFDISNTIDRTFGKGKSFDIFSPDTKKFLTDEASKAIVRIGNRMERLNALADAYKSRLSKINQEDEQAVRLKERLLRIERDRASLKEDVGDLEIARRTIQESGTMGGRARTLLGKIPGLGGLMRGGIGLGGMALGGLGLAGGFAYSRAMGGFNAFEQSAEQRLALRGRGIRDVRGTNAALRAIGYNPSEVREAQEQGMGIFGTGASQTDSSQLLRRMRFSRMTGMGSQAIQGMFAGTQAQGGFNAANKAFEEFRATVMADKLEHALAPYLEAVSGLLSQINEDGLSLTGDAIRSIATIAGQGENVSAQQAARMIGGIDAMIKGSSGDVKAFYMQAFANRGLGGGTLGGSEAMTDLGLFGGSESAAKGFQKEGLLSGRAIQDFKSAGLLGQDVARQRASAIVSAMDEIRQRFPGEEALGPNASPEERRKARMQQTIARGHAMKRLTGAGNIIEAEARFGALQKMAGAKSPEEYERLAAKYEEQFGQKTMEEMMKTSEGHLKQIEAATMATKESLGEAVGPAILAMRELLVEIDNMLANTLGPIAKLVEGLTPFTENSWFTKMGKGLGGVAYDLFGASSDEDPGRTKRWSEGLGNVEGMSPIQRQSLINQYKSDIELVRAQKSQAERSGEELHTYEGLENRLQTMIRLLEEANKRYDDMLKFQAQNNKYASEVAKGANKPKAKQGQRPSTVK